MAAKNAFCSATLSLPLPSIAAATPDSADGAPIPASDDPDPTREPKRRRYCPKALEKVEDLQIAPHNSNPSFSFTFDTKSASSSPEVTPKFGSFNFQASDSHGNGISKQQREEVSDEEEEAEAKPISSFQAVEETKSD